MLNEHKHVIAVIVDTKKTKEDSEPFIRQLGFNKNVVVDSQGYSIGIWFMWLDEVVDLEGQVTSPWAAHAIISLKFKPLPWLISGVYASPRVVEKKEALAEVTFIGQDCVFPYIYVGDFNALVFPEDKRVGRPPMPA